MNLLGTIEQNPDRITRLKKEMSLNQITSKEGLMD